MTNRISISVVDDDESSRESLCALLRVCDYDVNAFENAEEFLSSNIWANSSCLLVDASLPGVSGPDLQRCLRALQNTIPVIFITGYEDPELKARVVAAGAVDCLSKPFEEDDLLSTLRRALAAERVPA